jgi:hypothetical protein
MPAAEAARNDASKHRYGIQSVSPALAGGSSENNVLMAFILACWRWLTSPALEAPPPASPPTRPAIAALPAARPRFVLLASIHVPWQRLRA